MAKKSQELSQQYIEFIKKQKIFFVGTVSSDGQVTISPKGFDSLKIVNPNKIIWVDVSGSTNETAVNVQRTSNMTIMFTAFEGKYLTLKLYGKSWVTHKSDDNWDNLYKGFGYFPKARQIFEFEIEHVVESCGRGIPRPNNSVNNIDNN